VSELEPAALMIALLASVYGALAHLFWGQRWRHLPLFLGTALIGCLMSYAFNLHFIGAGPVPAGVPLVESTIAAWIMLILATRLRV
jgi:hypothetical protein